MKPKRGLLFSNPRIVENATTDEAGIMMKIKRVSPVTGKVNEMQLNITEEQISRWQRGELIQNVMPQLTADEREFLISGCTKEDWDAIVQGSST